MGLAFLALAAVQGAAAPPSPAARENPEAIIVTGSRIPRTDLTAVSPVTMVKGEEIKLQGATNVEEVLNRLPQVNPSQGEFVSAGATGTATVDLRGLGAVRTLGAGQRPSPHAGRSALSRRGHQQHPDIAHPARRSADRRRGRGLRLRRGRRRRQLHPRHEARGPQGRGSDQRLSARQPRTHSCRGCSTSGKSHIQTAASSTAGAIMLSVAFGHSFFDDRAHITLYGGYRRIAGLTQDRRDYSACAHHRAGSSSEADVDPRMRRRDSRLSRKLLRQSGQCIPGYGRPDVRARHRPIQLSRRGISTSGRTSDTPPAALQTSISPARSRPMPKSCA